MLYVIGVDLLYQVAWPEYPPRSLRGAAATKVAAARAETMAVNETIVMNVRKCRSRMKYMNWMDSRL